MPSVPEDRSQAAPADYDRRVAEALDRLDDARGALHRRQRRWRAIGVLLAVSAALFALGMVLGHGGGAAAAGLTGLLGLAVGFVAAAVRYVADRRGPHPREAVVAAERHHRNVTMGWE